MDSNPDKQAVKNAWAAFSTRDARQIAAVFTEDAQWLAPAGNATARFFGKGHQIVGRAEIVQFLAHDFHRLFVADVEIGFTGLHADGPVVVLEQSLRATLAGGRVYDNEYCFVITLRDGLIHRVREYMDTRRGHECIFGESQTRAA